MEPWRREWRTWSSLKVAATVPVSRPGPGRDRLDGFGRAGQAPSERDARRISRAAPPDAARQRFLAMFARAYFPRPGQLLIVPREGDFITRADPNVEYARVAWSYDVSIPLMFGRPCGENRCVLGPSRAAGRRAHACGVAWRDTPDNDRPHITGFAAGRCSTASGDAARPDGMRRDYFDRYAASMPTLTALRQQSAWFTQARVNVLPSNTAVGHSTISTGADPRVHGITGVSVRSHSRTAPRPVRWRSAAAI